jgi:hypothetical protein
MAVRTIASIPPSGSPERRDIQRQFEAGEILFFPRSPLSLPPADLDFLRGRRQTGAGFHKNIAYRPASDRLTGAAGGDRNEHEKMRVVMARFSAAAIDFVAGLFPSYASSWTIDYASFRPLEEEGRDLGVHSRNDLMHVDAFPTRPTRGDRILRFFVNANESEPRRWMTGTETFEPLAQRFAVSSGLLGRARRPGWEGTARRIAAALGLPVRPRSAYDEFMLRFHHFLKENRDYQATAEREFPIFPPGSSWMVFTDTVSHAVLSGRFALEQTFIVSRSALAEPEKAPIAVLERIAGAAMA